jgi:hypothetical protein
VARAPSYLSEFRSDEHPGIRVLAATTPTPFRKSRREIARSIPSSRSLWFISASPDLVDRRPLQSISPYHDPK